MKLCKQLLHAVLKLLRFIYYVKTRRCRSQESPSCQNRWDRVAFIRCFSVSLQSYVDCVLVCWAWVREPSVCKGVLVTRSSSGAGAKQLSRRESEHKKRWRVFFCCCLFFTERKERGNGTKYDVTLTLHVASSSEWRRHYAVKLKLLVFKAGSWGALHTVSLTLLLGLLKAGLLLHWNKHYAV